MALPWYKWQHTDWLTSETRFTLSLIERGLYRDLLDIHYSEGSISADVDVLIRMCACSETEFKTAWEGVAKFFDPHPTKEGRLVNRKALSIIEEQAKYQKTKQKNGRLGGRPRKTDRKATGFQTKTETKAITTHNNTVSTSNEVDTPKPPQGAIPAPTPKRQVFGEFGWVQLSEQEVQKLHERVGIETAADYIARFDQWVEEAPNAKHSGVKRKDRKAYASILNWIDRDQKEGKHDTRTKRQQIADADDIAILGALRKRSLDRAGAQEVAQDLPDVRSGDDRGRGERILRLVSGS